MKGDTAIEPAKQLSVRVWNATGGTIVQATGRVTILNDDPPVGGLHVDVGDVEVLEGGSGTRSAAFTVAALRAEPRSRNRAVQVRQWQRRRHRLHGGRRDAERFAAGQIAKTVAVAVAGDRGQ